MHAAEVGAVAIISDSAGRLLLHLRDDKPGIAWPNYWSVLGGGCDPGEHPDQAVTRELEEEAGLGHVAVEYLFDIADAASGDLLAVYHGVWDGDPNTLPLGEGQELRFFAPTELSALILPPHIRDAVQRWLGR